MTIDIRDSCIEELKAHLRSEIEKEQIFFHEKLGRLRARLANSRSDHEDDCINAQMKMAYREHRGVIYPLRAELDCILRAQASILATKPLFIFMPTPPPP